MAKHIAIIGFGYEEGYEDLYLTDVLEKDGTVTRYETETTEDGDVLTANIEDEKLDDMIHSMIEWHKNR